MDDEVEINDDSGPTKPAPHDHSSRREIWRGQLQHRRLP